MYSLDSVWERPEDDERLRGFTRAAWDPRQLAGVSAQAQAP